MRDPFSRAALNGESRTGAPAAVTTSVIPAASAAGLQLIHRQQRDRLALAAAAARPLHLHSVFLCQVTLLSFTPPPAH